MRAGQPVVIVDITGAHWGLKSSADGKGEGFRVAIFGGKHADVPLEENAGAVVARAIVEKRFSAILDFSIMTKAAMKRFLLAFAEELYRINELPIHLICDEADRYAPQKPDGDDAKLIAAFDDIVSRGGIKGIGVSLITQRSAKLNKNLLTQCELLIALRIVHPLDAKSVMEWIEMHATEAEAKEMLSSLPTLPIGTAWFWWPNDGDRNIFERVTIRTRTTFDSGATPKVGAVRAQPKHVTKIDLQQLGADIAAAVERAKANDPAALRAEIARLKGEVSKATSAQLSAELMSPKPLIQPQHEAALNRLAQQIEAARVIIVGQGERITKAGEELARLREELTGAAKAHLHAIRAPAPLPLPAKRAQAVAAVKPAKVLYSGTPIGAPANDDSAMSTPQRKILTILAQRGEGCTMEKIALLGCYRIGGGFRNLFSQLRAKGWIEGENAGTMTITDAGRDALGAFEPLPVGSALGRYWLNSSAFGMAEKKILGLLLENPAGMTMEEVASALGYSIGGGFRNLFSKLRTAGVLVGSNSERMRAHPDLFD